MTPITRKLSLILKLMCYWLDLTTKQDIIRAMVGLSKLLNTVKFHCDMEETLARV